MPALLFFLLVLCLAFPAGKRLFRAERIFREGIRRAEQEALQGKWETAADMYLEQLDKACARPIPNTRHIVLLTDRIRPLLARAGRREDERRILERSMRLCLSATGGRSWARWQRRIEKLDSEASATQDTAKEKTEHRT